MTGIFKFWNRSRGGYWARLLNEDRETVARNAAAAAERMRARGDNVTEVQDIRRREAERAAA
jgi:hypothetical protein